MAETERCAGILFVSSRGNGLFLKRSDHGDYAGWWGLPGGHLRPSETHHQAARRECREEIGQCPRGELIEVNRQVTTIEGDDQKHTRTVDYVTYLQNIEYEFIPELNKEHQEFIWAPPGNTPKPLHPGLEITLKKMHSDELGIAELMQQGLVSSPQKYGNMWLFDIRITGTGLSYRSGPKEFVWRDASLYLNERFLKRINGLPVIFEHPKTSTLNTKEYVERNIGSVFIPYIKGDEVWSIVRIYDEFAAKIMSENRLSTSPAVVLSGNDVKVQLEKDEDPILFEGVPRIVDHIAICLLGVWDKGNEPTGVASIAVGDLVMADEDTKAAAMEAARKADVEKAADAKAKADAEKAKADAEAKAKADAAKAKADAEAGELLDKTLKCLDSMSARFDAFEEAEKTRQDRKAQKRADKAKAKADAAAKAKADAGEDEKKKEEEKEKADAKAKADAENEVRKRIADVEQRLPKQITDADYAAMADAQVKADRIMLMHDKRAPGPWGGEALLAYRRRLSEGLKEFSPRWKEVNLGVVAADETAFSNIEQMIYADAEAAGLNPPAPAEGFLREIVDQDRTGRKISTFVGNPSAWMEQFSSGRRRLAGIRNKS
jgi:8-oxo-dGTP pyrophosphatase MutT (NUDIX family)